MLTEKLTTLVEPTIESLGYELVGIKMIGSESHPTLRVYIDADDGITVDDCAIVSRQVSAIMDVEDPISSEYMLEVSSPGLDRPLMKISDFERFSGSEVKVKLNSGVGFDNRKNWAGILKGLVDQDVKLEVEGEDVLLPFAEIRDCRLVPNIQPSGGKRK